MSPNYAPAPSHNNSFYDYSGCINIKTTLSSGSGTFADIISAAQESQTDYVITADANNFSPDLNLQRYMNNVFLFVGGEFGYLDGRILNFDLANTDHLQGPGRSQVNFADIISRNDHNRSEGLFVLAHPLKPGYRLSEPFPTGIDGIEIMNLKDVWQRAWMSSKFSFFWNILVYPFNSKLSYIRLLTSYGESEYSFWDKLNQSHSVYGFFGSDAEAKIKIYKQNALPFPSYRTLFSIVKNHILLKSELIGNSEQDKMKISSALRSGQFYMSVDILQDPKGFEAYIKDEKNELSPIGSNLKFNDNLELVLKLPSKPNLKFETVVYKDGDKVLTSNSPETRYALHGPGVYRGLVRVKIPLPFPERSRWLNWIVTNPFYVQ